MSKNNFAGNASPIGNESIPSNFTALVKSKFEFTTKEEILLKYKL
jgi:hypothetical protein